MQYQPIQEGGAITIVLFGGTGDLADHKLFPALFDLYVRSCFPEQFTVVGFSVEEYDDSSYRAFIRETLSDSEHSHSTDDIDAFLEHVTYLRGDFRNATGYEKLKEYFAGQNDADPHVRLLYLATPPELYDAIFEHISSSGICDDAQENIRTRLLVEKPFGEDIESARELDTKLSQLFSPEQIFRVDHYLGKAAIQNIITFRFSNFLFSGAWDKDHIESVHLLQREDFGVEGRGAFYDQTGALRDVGANHMMQMLSLTAMENPGELATESIRDRRAEVLESLRIMGEDEVHRNTYRAQYDGYRDVSDVAADSTTETYFCLKAYIENERWKGVPFYIEHGKGLDAREARITITFREPVSCVCDADNSQKHGHANVLTMHLQPKRGITIRFWTRAPELQFTLEPQDLSFTYSETDGGESRRGAYESILYHALAGDQMLFASSREVDAAWQFITPILKAWEHGSPELETYPFGTHPDGCEYVKE